jgi:hypothetical protein
MKIYFDVCGTLELVNWSYFKKKTGTIYCYHTEEFINPTKTEASESMF